MRIAVDAWLARVLGRPAFRVDLPAFEASAPAEIASHARDNAGAFYFTKVATDGIDRVASLGAAGFVVVDVNVVLDRAAPPDDSLPANRGVDIGPCTNAAGPAVLDIAATCFKYTRFHLDPKIGLTAANQVKRDWVENYVLGRRGDHLFVAYLQGRPAGFLAALVTETGGSRTAVIDLIGVANDAQRRGVGVELVSAFSNHYRKTCSRLLVGTQVANVPSIRLYEKLGFSLCQSQYVLHKHAD